MNVLFRYVLTISVSVVLWSCSIIDPKSTQNDGVLVINNKQDDLSHRISRVGAGVILVSPTSGNLQRNRIQTSSDDQLIWGTSVQVDHVPATNQPLSRIARITPPEYKGTRLTASHVWVDGNLAYIAYNRMGPEYLGAVEILDVTDVHNPRLLSQVIFPTMDISAIVVKDGYVYLAAARDRDQFINVATPAFLGRMRLRGTTFTEEFDVLPLAGFVATDIAIHDNRIYVTSGSDGDLTIVDIASFTPIHTLPASDLRAVAVNNQVFALRSGTEGITLFDTRSGEMSQRMAIPQDVPNAKRTMQLLEDVVVTAEGARGAGIYNLRTGALSQRITIPRIESDVLVPDDIVTNAVSVSDGLLFMANGGAGLSISEFTEGDILQSVGIAEIGGSANYVQSEGSYIFIASGANGLDILKRQVVEPPVVTPAGISCENAVPYQGFSSWLNINSGENFIYSGAASLQGINVNQGLTFCGSITVTQQLNLNSNAVFNMKGALAFGQFGTGATMHINSGATLRVEGSVVIWSNLNLNSNARIEFVGSGSSITIYGNVTRGNNVSITGNFTDTFNKLGN